MALYRIVSIIAYNSILGITEFYHFYLDSPKIFPFINIMDYNNFIKIVLYCYSKYKLYE